MKVYHCGASSKDAGKRITTITRLLDMETYKDTIRVTSTDAADARRDRLYASESRSEA